MNKYLTSLGVSALTACGLLVSSITATPTLADSISTCWYSQNANQISARAFPDQGYADFTNLTTDCIYKVGIASYKVYSTDGFDYARDHNYHEQDPSVPVDRNWLYTQKLFDSSAGVINPGQHIRLYFRLPECAYQLDTFQGDVVEQFTPGGENYMGGHGTDRTIPSDHLWLNTSMGLCRNVVPTPTPTPVVTPTPTPVVTPTPTPTPTSTPTPTVTPTPVVTSTPTVTPTPTITPTPVVTPTPTPTPIVTPTPTPTPTAVSTPTPTPTPTGQVLGTTPTPTPKAPAELPNTGPGAAVVISMMGVVGALLGKKYFIR